MRGTIIVTIVGVFVAAAAASALPADVVAISAKAVEPAGGAELYFLGHFGGGYLYNGSAAALARVAPYRVLDRGAREKDYFIVWAPPAAALSAADFEHLGAAARLLNDVILVGVSAGMGVGELRAIDRRVELVRLTPITPVDWSYDGEPPPSGKDPAIEAAINTITASEYAGYIQTLQNFGTRVTDTDGNDAARDYVRNFFAAQNLDASLFEFKIIGFDGVSYADAAGRIYVETDHATLKRTTNAGASWDTVWGTGTRGVASTYWLNGNAGFIAGYNNTLDKTTNGGNSWTALQFRPGYPQTKYYPYVTSFVNANTGWLGGRVVTQADANVGFMLKTSNGGANWVDQTVPGDFKPTTMAFYDASHGWAGAGGVGGIQGIYYTSNGSSWQACSLPAALTIRDIAATGPAEAWAVESAGRILHTTNGLNWSYVDPGVAGNYTTLEFPDATHGFAAGSKLIATTDGGASWHELSAAPQFTYGVMSFADKDHGVVGDYAGNNLYRTANGGQSFVSIIGSMDLRAENVIGERRGTVAPDEVIIIGGHFDCISDLYPSTAPGAEDNGSGSACAMAASRAFKNLTFKRTVRYVVFGDEEYGLNGSWAYANYCAGQGQKIVAMLNADMVAYDEENGARDDYSIAYGNYPWLFDYVRTVGGFYGNNIIYDHYEFYGSDHASFWGAGYAALGAIEGAIGEGGVLDYPYYHTTEDKLDKLQPALGVRLVRDLAATFAHLGRSSYIEVEEPWAPRGPEPPRPQAFAVYPNPYRYSSAETGVNFVGLATPATVEVYDLAGRRVAREDVPAGRETYVWQPVTDAGTPLTPGVYFYAVTGREQSKRGKLVVGD